MFENCKRLSHVAVRLNNSIVVFGGRNTDGEPIFDQHMIWEYNCNTEQWRTYKMIPNGEPAPFELLGSCATTIGADIYVFGGGLTVGGSKRTNDMWKLSKLTHEDFTCRKIEFHSNEKLPSPRSRHSCWENSACLWVFGGIGDSPTGYLDDHGEFSVFGINNQLLHFDPCNKTWTNPECFGTIPSPRYAHSTAVVRDNVWLFGGNDRRILNALNGLFQFDTCTYTWTRIRTAGIRPQGRAYSSLTAVSDTQQLILHGGIKTSAVQNFFSDTWILDLASQTWRLHKSPMALPRADHTGSQSVSKSVIIIGGCTENEATAQSYTSTFHVMLEPKSLQQLSMKTIHSHQTWLPWKHLPQKLIAQLGLSVKRASKKAESEAGIR